MIAQFKLPWLMVITVLILGSTPSWAQSVVGDPVDLNFEIINATTGQPGSIDRLLIQYSSTHLSPVLDIQPTDSEFEVPAVPIRSSGKYVITAWSHGVPYHWNMRGRKILESPVKLHVFDTRSGVEGASITGLNLLVHKTQSLLELEYMLKIENSARPQVTLNGDPSLMIKLPQGVDKAVIIHGRGPDPEEIHLTGLSGGMVAIKAPLTTGNNIIRLKTTLPWQENLDIPVVANAPIEAWSLMTTPENLDVQSFDLEPSDASDYSGYSRYKGPPLEENGSFSFRIASSRGGGEEENLFSKPAPETVENNQKAEKTDPEKDKGFPFVVLTPIFVVLLVIVISKRRQS